MACHSVDMRGSRKSAAQWISIIRGDNYRVSSLCYNPHSDSSVQVPSIAPLPKVACRHHSRYSHLLGCRLLWRLPVPRMEMGGQCNQVSNCLARCDSCCSEHHLPCHATASLGMAWRQGETAVEENRAWTVNMIANDMFPRTKDDTPATPATILERRLIWLFLL